LTQSIERAKDGQLAFANKRAEVWWKFRETLDPDQPDGSAIALPADPEPAALGCSRGSSSSSGRVNAVGYSPEWCSARGKGY
jgi:hypothetical protein